LLATFKDSLFSLASLVALHSEASINAHEIAEIRKQVEQQKESVALVVRDANAAQHQLSDAKKLFDEAQGQLGALQTIVSEARRDVANIKSVAEFSVIVLAASNDDRTAFDKLLSIANAKGNDFQDIALRAALQIASADTFLSYPAPWETYGVDPKTASLDTFEEILSRVKPIEKPDVLETLWKQDRFSKFTRLQFLATTVQNTQSVSALKAACKLMDNEAHKKKNILLYELYWQWWLQEMQNYKK
jgi:hypothetical protein